MSTSSEESEHPVSPCTSLCVIDQTTGYCEGCFRTWDEIARWSAMTAEEKRSVLASIHERRNESRGND